MHGDPIKKFYYLNERWF